MKEAQINSRKSRRNFLHTTAAAAGGVLVSPHILAANPHVNVDNTIANLKLCFAQRQIDLPHYLDSLGHVLKW